MSHETHNSTVTERSKSQVAFSSSFWLIVILVGLFIGALNFINVMGHGHSEEGKAEGTEMHSGAGHEAAEHKEATHEEAKPEGKESAEHNMNPEHATEHPGAEKNAPEHAEHK